MKKWTVMLIPHDRGDRRSFDMSAVHVWWLVALFMGTAFVSGFFYQRYRIAEANALNIEQYYKENPQTVTVMADMGTSADDQARIEASIREQYQSRDATLTAELTRLYDLEADIRTLAGLPSREPDAAMAVDKSGGQGGGPGELDQVVTYRKGEKARPRQVIYGMSRPSADLIAQEIAVRRTSLEDLRSGMKRVEDYWARVPSTWPSADRARRLSSTFGLRKDPFNGRMRRHAGLDISAPQGTPIKVTARGVVKEAGWGDYYGNFVEVDHGNNLVTLYAHMSAISVKSGQTVDRGEVLGKVGSTGRASGAHIHYEVHKDGVPVDPAQYVGR